MSKYVSIGMMPVKDGCVRDFMKIISQVDASKMGGCFRYDVSWNDTSVAVYEVWNSKSDHDESLKDPEIMNLIREAMPLLAGEPTSLFEGETQ
jgi:quinol monooxygenase YgiN